MDEVRRLELVIGDTVLVQRAGDVIPKIVGILKKKRSRKTGIINLPKTCPACGSDIVVPEGEVIARCSGGLICQAQCKERIRHFASRLALDIEGLGEKLVVQLVDEGLIQNPADLYSLREADLVKLERMAPKSANKLLDALQKSRSTTLARFIYALGPEIARSLFELGDILLRLGDALKAEAWLRHSLEIRRKHYDSDDYRTANAENALGASLAAQGRFDEAEALLVQSLPIIESRYGAEGLRTKTGKARLADLYRALGRLEKAADDSPESGQPN